MRGKVRDSERIGLRIGITPAGAGKSQKRVSALQPLQDHPRRCGEKPDYIGYLPDGRGSPPQVRGKVVKLKNLIGIYRITPAGAGKSIQMNAEREYN